MHAPSYLAGDLQPRKSVMNACTSPVGNGFSQTPPRRADLEVLRVALSGVSQVGC